MSNDPYDDSRLSRDEWLYKYGPPSDDEPDGECMCGECRQYDALTRYRGK